MSLSSGDRVALALGGAALLVSASATRPHAAQPGTGQNGTGSTTTVASPPENYHQLSYAQRWTLIAARGFFPMPPPGLIIAVPIMTLADADRVWNYWREVVTSIELDLPIFGAWEPPPSWKRLDRLKESLHAQLARRGGSDTYDDFAEYAPFLRYPYLSQDESIEFWVGVHKVALDFGAEHSQIGDELAYSPSRWNRAMSALGDAVREAPRTFGEYVGKVGEYTARTIAQVGGSAAGGLLEGLLTGLSPQFIAGGVLLFLVARRL